MRGDLNRAIEGGMLVFDGHQPTLTIVLDGCDRLPRHGAELQRELTLPRRASGRTIEVIVLLVHDVEGMRRKPSQLGMWLERHPAVGWDWGQTAPDAPHDFHLLLDRIHIGGARLRAVAEE